MNLARIDLTQNPPAVVADAPPFVGGALQLPSSTWADLTAQGYPGVGYWPIVTVTPTFDPTTQMLGPAAQTIDIVNKQVVLTPAVIPLVVPVPASITKLQAMLALNNANLLTQVQAAVNAAGGTALLKWENATMFFRNDPLTNQLGQAAGLTPAQLDQLFIAGAQIN